MRSFPTLLSAATALLALAPAARAGVHVEDVDFLFLEPSVGAETLRVRLGSPGDALSGDLKGAGQTSTSLSLGAIAGVRVGSLSLSMLLQRGTHSVDPSLGEKPATADKIFADLGFHADLGAGVVVSPHVSFGLAYLRSPEMAEALVGPGAKLGVSLELYPCSALSVGMRLDADGQAYKGNGMVSVAYGFTLAGSIGLHL